MSVHFSSKSDEWETPVHLWDELDKVFAFNLDVCATHENAKCHKYFTKKEDGLKQQWTGTVWMNPPYGREIGKWMKKAYESSQEPFMRGTALMRTTVVCLVPARTDTKWWHDYAIKGEIKFIRGRLKFNGHKNSAPFPSAIVIFK